MIFDSKGSIYYLGGEIHVSPTKPPEKTQVLKTQIWLVQYREPCIATSVYKRFP